MCHISYHHWVRGAGASVDFAICGAPEACPLQMLRGDCSVWICSSPLSSPTFHGAGQAHSTVAASTPLPTTSPQSTQPLRMASILLTTWGLWKHGSLRMKGSRQVIISSSPAQYTSKEPFNLLLETLLPFQFFVCDGFLSFISICLYPLFFPSLSRLSLFTQQLNVPRKSLKPVLGGEAEWDTVAVAKRITQILIRSLLTESWWNLLLLYIFSFTF